MEALPSPVVKVQLRELNCVLGIDMRLSAVLGWLLVGNNYREPET